MRLPGIVEDALDGEEVLSRVSLSGDDEVFVTPDRTLVYRAGGVLSDESVEAYPLGVSRLTVSEGRRKATITFEYPVEDPLDFSVPKGDLTETIQPILASVVEGSGATDADERFLRAFRFSELTLVVTSERLIKNVGSALWDGDYDDYHYEDVTGLEYERGEVATGVVMTVDGRKERIKAPNDRLAELREHLESAVLSYHDVDSPDQLAPREEDDGTDDADDRQGEDPMDSFSGGGIDPLDAGSGPGADAPADVGSDPVIDDAGGQSGGGSGREGAGETPPDHRADPAADAGDSANAGDSADRGDRSGDPPARADRAPRDADPGSAGDYSGRNDPEVEAGRGDPGEEEVDPYGRRRRGRRDAPEPPRRDGRQRDRSRPRDPERREDRRRPEPEDRRRDRRDSTDPDREGRRPDRRDSTDPDRGGRRPEDRGTTGDRPPAHERSADARSGPNDPAGPGGPPGTTDRRGPGDDPEEPTDGDALREADPDTDRDGDPEPDREDAAESSDDDGDVETPFTEEFEPASEDLHSKVVDELDDLRETVERQNELLARQQRAIERLVEELREDE